MAGIRFFGLLFSALALAFAPAAAAEAPHEMTPVDLEAFFDGLVPYALHRGDTAGVTISVVKDGKMIFAKGYGYADLKSHTPVDPENSLFRIASISKTFAWTAVMQLVEQGKLDLDRDINDYLDFKIPPAFGKPITLRNLMTHTSGFEESRARAPVDEKSAKEFDLAKYMAANIPARIFPPGEVLAYSNYGCALAGYIVTRISGERYESYIADHILKPLKMNHTTVEQPLPDLSPAKIVSNYHHASDGKALPFQFLFQQISGAMTTSATDMTHFMMAHLQNGEYDGAQILKPETAIQMHAHVYAPKGIKSAFALGFQEEVWKGIRFIGHGGDITGFHSLMSMFPDSNIGLFTSFNSDGNETGPGIMRTVFVKAFIDRYFPVVVPVQEPTVPAETAKADGQRVAGWYVTSRRRESGLGYNNLFGQSDVIANDDGVITAPRIRDIDQVPKRWREVGPLLYREIGGNGYMAFDADETGAIKSFALSDTSPVSISQRVSPMATRPVIYWLLGLACLVIVGALVVWGGGAWQRRHYDRPMIFAPDVARSRLASRLGAVVQVLTGAAWYWTILHTTAMTWFSSTGQALLVGLYLLGVLALAGAAAEIVNAAWLWSGNRRSVQVRVAESVLALAGIVFCWILVVYGGVSFNFQV